LKNKCHQLEQASGKLLGVYPRKESILVFNKVGCVDNFADFQREFKKDGKFIPVVFPAFNSIRVF
jgi:hypothetical protein